MTRTEQRLFVTTFGDFRRVTGLKHLVTLVFFQENEQILSDFVLNVYLCEFLASPVRSRNQEKLAYAESAYNDAAHLVTKKIEEKHRRQVILVIDHHP